MHWGKKIQEAETPMKVRMRGVRMLSVQQPQHMKNLGAAAAHNFSLIPPLTPAQHQAISWMALNALGSSYA